MSELTMFDEALVQELRRHANQAWRKAMPAEMPQGWSVSSVDGQRVLAVFPALRLKPGLALRAYQFREGRDGEGVMWAMPETVALPAPPNPRRSTAPPRPAKALKDFREALDGDGTPLAYLSASLFTREAQEFGAKGHGVRWGASVLLAQNPWAGAGRPAEASPHEGPTGTLDEWEWIEPAPDDWRPAVRVDGDQATVTFYTFTGLGSQRIMRHVDSYPPQGYVFASAEHVLAKGPRGFVW